MAGDDPSKTVSVKLTPVTQGGVPSYVDEHYDNAVAAALQGGDATQAYFDARNQTAEFWAWMANTLDDKEDPWAPGTDAQGHPIQMASNGNLEMRMGTFWRGPADGVAAEHLAAQVGDDPPVVAIASVQTHNTTNNLSGGLTLGVGLLGIPPGIKLTQLLFADLLKPVYANMKVALGKLVQQLKASTETENPALDPEDQVEDPLGEASSDTEEIVGDLAEEGAEYLSIEWGSVGLETAGLVGIAAIPMILQFLAHQMFNSVQVINRTDEDFSLSMYLAHGVESVKPAGGDSAKLPKMDYNTDSWGDRTTVKVAYEANFQLVNWSQFGAIGHIISLAPANGGKTAKVLTWIPWAGENTIWVGEGLASDSKTWEVRSNYNGNLTQKADFGDYTVSMATNKLSGKTDDRYFYANIVTIDKKS